jgi:hypothetical protein
MSRIRRLFLTLAIAGAAVVGPVMAAPAAHARSCKWVLVPYDPTTGTSVWACSTARA